VQRCVALVAAIRGQRLHVRASHAARRAVTRASRRGAPITLTAHHDILVLAPRPRRRAEPSTAIPLNTAASGPGATTDTHAVDGPHNERSAA
jgi:hypothetical protein